ncbi:MAG: hypothetical protein K8F62_03370, partial [Pseudorhodoplanes sp.]|nr:hypothetical protein [Pseudorhodoplanes sp.]
MWNRVLGFVRDWSILIGGVLLIVPLLYLSSHVASSKSTASTASPNRSDEAAAPRVPLNQAETTRRSAAAAQPPAQALTNAPVMSHERMAAATTAPTG